MSKPKINTVAPKYRRNVTVEEMEQIAAVNVIALNILEMEKILNASHNQ